MTLQPHHIELLKSLKPEDFVPTTLDCEWDHTDDMSFHIIHDHGFIIAAGVTNALRNSEFLDQVVDDSDLFDKYRRNTENMPDDEIEPLYCLGNASEFFDLSEFTWLTFHLPALTISEFINIILGRINANQETETSASGPFTCTL